ncbi:hypothetical protein N7539_008083 [Penicillium diatomitis]|uniref:Aminoglycoside phosphotransferase domain-containing protein n=1 Tax=Penicillium diatomitis TaxID=2819901 RepID=A0A9X0BNB1_9EURO|nr:uncharacterized protein N7539_008083 [Penicillium diatomitis]KAJ5475017.1 hypothetical protein N7539_008083 [Penicillium diatomitis]
MRFPLPYGIGEDPHSSNSDENVLCEAGTHAWIEQNCATVPIPRLCGLGLSNGRTFTLRDNLPTLIRAEERLRRSVLPMSGYPPLGKPYLLIEYIDPSRGKSLSETWKEGRHDTELRSNFFHSLSRVILALARTPLPKIGSFTLDGDGYLILSNRLLTMQIQQLENEPIPAGLPRNLTYASVDAHICDRLAFHESRLRRQPNAIIDIPDGAY